MLQNFTTFHNKNRKKTEIDKIVFISLFLSLSYLYLLLLIKFLLYNNFYYNKTRSIEGEKKRREWKTFFDY
jgi:hypothetical protein